MVEAGSKSRGAESSFGSNGNSGFAQSLFSNEEVVSVIPCGSAEV